ncbi:MAG: Vitamin B12 dependent methionine synthase activation subunit [Oscillospiraceae bacterium]|nr:Vitamin B12 dependent methionine synthase activation subunit [Oscillospiraceae bacterium]
MDWKEVYRYMGYRGQTPSPEEHRMIQEAARAVEEASSPRWVWARVPVWEDGEGAVLDGWETGSRGLAGNLRGCAEAFLAAFTLGGGVDLVLRRLEKQDMSRALAAQAAAAAMIERFCDEREAELSAQIPGFFLRPRFSPGYEDFSIRSQEEFLRRLDAPKRIGLTLTAGGMLTPSKSVTAVIGISAQAACGESRCGQCGSENCPFREAVAEMEKGR